MTFASAIDNYLNAIVSDYEKWSDGSEISKEMLREFKEKLRYEFGNKYIKVITKNSVHSFIVIKDTPKFKRGDILMAKSWKAPATNFARGNILTTFNVRWTGAAI